MREPKLWRDGEAFFRSNIARDDRSHLLTEECLSRRVKIEADRNRRRRRKYMSVQQSWSMLRVLSDSSISYCRLSFADLEFPKVVIHFLPTLGSKRIYG